jgi:hypothetical protein
MILQPFDGENLLVESCVALTSKCALQRWVATVGISQDRNDAPPVACLGLGLERALKPSTETVTARASAGSSRSFFFLSFLLAPNPRLYHGLSSSAP